MSEIVSVFGLLCILLSQHGIHANVSDRVGRFVVKAPRNKTTLKGAIQMKVISFIYPQGKRP